MRFAPVTRFVAFVHLAVVAAMFVPALLALADGEGTLGYVLGAFVGTAVAVLSFAMGVGFKDRPVVRSGLRELLLSLMIFWAVVPLAAAVPFIIAGESLARGWFEAVSALTTTGGWLSDPLARATTHGMIYRASLQWLGGLISLGTAAAVFVRPEFIGAAPLVPPFSRGESGSLLRAFDRAVWTFLPIYAALTGIGLLGFLLVGVGLADGAVMSLSFVATGGFVPAREGMIAYSGGAIFVGGLLTLVSAMNFILIATFALGQGGRVRQGRDPETPVLLILVPLVALMFWLTAGAGNVLGYFPQLFNAISIIATNGQTLGETAPLTPILVTAVIGGAAVSTAGGIKILRWLITMRRTSEELWKLTHPGGVLGRRPNVNEFGVWIHTLAFAFILAILVLTTAIFGHTLEVSAATAVAVITNAGPILELAPAVTADYRIFDPVLRTILGFAMIAGRLELVILLVILSRRFWLG